MPKTEYIITVSDTHKTNEVIMELKKIHGVSDIVIFDELKCIICKADNFNDIVSITGVSSVEESSDMFIN